MEDARAGGGTLADAAKSLGLPAVTMDIDRSGRDAAGKFVAAIPAATSVISGAFSSDVGVDTYPVDADGGYVWYEVASVTPARDRTLDEVKTEVEQRWHDDQVAEHVKTKAADLLGKLKSGNSFDALAKADNVKLQTRRRSQARPREQRHSRQGDRRGVSYRERRVRRAPKATNPPNGGVSRQRRQNAAARSEFGRRQEARAAAAASRWATMSSASISAGSKIIWAPPSIRPRWRRLWATTAPPDSE